MLYSSSSVADRPSPLGFSSPRFSSSSTTSSEHARACSFFSLFRPPLSPRPNPPFSTLRPACQPGCRALRCRPFVTLSVLLDYVFFSRASFLFLILLSLSPVFLFLPRRFAIFLCFCIFSRAILHLRHPLLSLSFSFSLLLFVFRPDWPVLSLSCSRSYRVF